MKKVKLIIVISIILLVCILVWMGYRKKQQDAMLPEPVMVSTISVQESTMPIEVSSIGTLSAKRVNVTPEVSGHVKQILFQDGQVVNQNDILVQLDDAVYSVKYQSAKAQLDFVTKDQERKLYLLKQGAISKQAIDQIGAELKEKASLEKEALVMVEKMQLKAPFAGVVSKSKVNVGEYVATGQDVVTLTDTTDLKIEYDLPEQYLAHLKLGQSVDVTTPAYPDKHFKASVSYVSPEVTIQNRSVSLYAKLDNSEHLLKPGMFVSVTQRLDQKEKSILIPARSLVPVLDGEQVYKVVDGKAVATSIKVGIHLGEQVAVLEGLSKNDLIITDGQLKIRNNMPVKVN